MKPTTSKNTTVNKYLHSLETPLKDLFFQIRESVLDAAPAAAEDIKWKNCLVYSGKKNMIQTVLGKEHISLIFFEGKQLLDPANLLEGEGNKTRTAKLTKENFKPAVLKALVKQAAKLAE
jgi:hypothetical protein